MSGHRQSKRRAAGTRDRIIELLRENPRSVEDLASRLGITLNAVRSQLTVLERDGFVQMVGERRGARRPSIIYGLTAEAERLLSRAYIPVLKALLKAISLKSESEHVEGVLREAGRSLADEIGRPSGDFHTRVSRVLSLLEELGAAMEVSESEGRLVLRGRGCPLSEAVAVEPRTCKCVETLLTELIGAKVEERCERGSKPHCEFVVLPEEEEKP